jgi:hypothetical protein
MKSYEERREERREYEADVYYEVWRSGGSPDRIDTDRVEQNYYDGLTEERAACVEIEKQRPVRDEELQEEPEC